MRNRGQPEVLCETEFRDAVLKPELANEEGRGPVQLSLPNRTRLAPPIGHSFDDLTPSFRQSSTEVLWRGEGIVGSVAAGFVAGGDAILSCPLKPALTVLS